MLVADARQHAGEELVEAPPVGQARELVVARFQVRTLGTVALLAHLAQRALGVERHRQGGRLVLGAFEHETRPQLVEALVGRERLAPLAARLVRQRHQAVQLVHVDVAAAAVGRRAAPLDRLQGQQGFVGMQVRTRSHATEEHHRVRRRRVHQRLGLVERGMGCGQVAQHDVGDRQVVEGAADVDPLLLLAPRLEGVLHQLDGALGAGPPFGLGRALVVILQCPAAQRERQVGTQAQYHGLALEAARRPQPFVEDLHRFGQPADVVEHDAQRVGDAYLQDGIFGRARQHHGLAGHLQRPRRQAAADRGDAQRVEREGLAAHRAADPEVGQRFVGGRLGLLELLAQREGARQGRERPHQAVAVAFAAHPLHRGQQGGQRARASLLGHTVERAQVVVQQVLFRHSSPHRRGRCRSPRPPEDAGKCRASRLAGTAAAQASHRSCAGQ